MDDIEVDSVPADDAFELLAHETRVRILEALADADGALAFSDVRERVGVRDPGQFNYHLQELVGRFVAKSERGYALTAAGRRVVGAVLSGAYTGRLAGDGTVLDATCLECGGRMEVRLRAEGVRITCTDCGLDYTHADVPAGVLTGTDASTAAERVERYLAKRQVSAEYGFCPNCEGRMTTRVRLASDDDAPGWLDAAAEPAVEFSCGRCGERWHSMVAVVVTTHPAVAGFLYEHGVDVRRTPNWELEWVGDGAAVRSRDPVRLDVTVRAADAARTFTFDADLDIVSESE